jgi:hypothetical protein
MKNLPTFEETFERQLFEAGENKKFYNDTGYIILKKTAATHENSKRANII